MKGGSVSSRSIHELHWIIVIWVSAKIHLSSDEFSTFPFRSIVKLPQLLAPLILCVVTLDLKCAGCASCANCLLFIISLGGSLYSGWCGEVRDVIYTDSGKVTVIYRVTVRGTDGEVPPLSSSTVITD